MGESNIKYEYESGSILPVLSKNNWPQKLTHYKYDHIPLRNQNWADERIKYMYINNFISLI